MSVTTVYAYQYDYNIGTMVRGSRATRQNAENEEEPRTESGAIGGLVGAPEEVEEAPEAPVLSPHGELRDDLGPFIRDVIRDEIRGLLDLHPSLHPGPATGEHDFLPFGRGLMPRRRQVAHVTDLEGDDDYPLGRGAVPKRQNQVPPVVYPVSGWGRRRGRFSSVQGADAQAPASC